MSKTVAFIHPDLGLGGAERLIVDAAVGVQNHGHKVHLFTTHHETDRCFKETRDGTLKILVFGDWMPRHVFHKFYILFATLRMLYCTLRVCLMQPWDVIIVDQVSTVLFLIRVLQAVRLCSSSAKILFYCHFPDKLLSVHNQDSPVIKTFMNRRAQQKEGIAKDAGKVKWYSKLYRFVFDALEEKSTNLADVIFVNSNFTAQVFAAAFPSIKTKPQVLYPPINCQAYDVKPPSTMQANEALEKAKQKSMIVSINRYERKKGIGLAIDAFAEVQQRVSKEAFANLVLVIAGGYDERLAENREHYQELVSKAQAYNLQDQVVFIRSFNDADRYILLHESMILLYTPENEHFGIVPVEAQYCGRCVIAVNSGGPLESVEHGKTGYLQDPEPKAFSDAMVAVLNMTEQERAAMGDRARQRAQKLFSLESFASQLNSAL